MGQGNEFVALLPIDFFKVKKDVTPRAPLSVLFNKAEEQCQPFLCTKEVKTYKTIVESFGIAFANYGLASAVLMPLFALLAARIGRKPAQAAVSLPQSERRSVSGEI